MVFLTQQNLEHFASWIYLACACGPDLTWAGLPQRNHPLPTVFTVNSNPWLHQQKRLLDPFTSFDTATTIKPVIAFDIFRLCGRIGSQVQRQCQTFASCRQRTAIRVAQVTSQTARPRSCKHPYQRYQWQVLRLKKNLRVLKPSGTINLSYLILRCPRY